MLASPPTEQDFVIQRGKTFKEVVRWETMPYLFVAIASIANVALARVTTQAPHNLPEGWNVAVVDAAGLTELNALSNPPKKKDYRRAHVVDATNISFELSSVGFGKHTANSGALVWRTPQSLADLTARMSIKDKYGGVVWVTSLNGGDLVITLDDAAKTITLTIAASVTAALALGSGVYDLEVEDGTGFVVAILTGAVEIVDEVTTPITP